MDNNIEIAKTEGLATGNTVFPTSQILPVAGGVAGGIVIGAVLYRFAIAPLITKIKAKKADKIVVEEKKEEKKES